MSPRLAHLSHHQNVIRVTGPTTVEVAVLGPRGDPHVEFDLSALLDDPIEAEDDFHFDDF
ncbi:MAG: hypothetical protein KY462_05045 [Actinobacteria bacterium]|nr:hypothetical protein [Actinomycetota bacterium]